jgi:hypothetical protein
MTMKEIFLVFWVLAVVTVTVTVLATHGHLQYVLEKCFA